jgi:hypothetical protein
VLEYAFQDFEIQTQESGKSIFVLATHVIEQRPYIIEIIPIRYFKSKEAMLQKIA